MVNGVARVISAEWLKLWQRRTTIVIPGLLILFALAAFFGRDFAVRRQFIGIPSGFYMAAGSISFILNVMALVTVIATCFHISREFSFGTIKAAWIRPMTRAQWYTGKLVSAGAAVGALFILVVGIILLLAAVRFGFADLLEKDYLIHSAGTLGWRLVLALGLTLWSLWALVAVMSMVSSLVNHPGGAIAAGLGLGLLSTVLAMFPALQPYLLSTYLSLPLEQMIMMSKGLPLDLTWGNIAQQTLLGGAVWMAIALVVGYRIIAKKEITF